MANNLIIPCDVKLQHCKKEMYNQQLVTFHFTDIISPGIIVQEVGNDIW